MDGRRHQLKVFSLVTLAPCGNRLPKSSFIGDRREHGWILIKIDKEIRLPLLIRRVPPSAICT